jgi:glycosyltransferase involved in cell wall biosynthesis
VSRRPVSVVVPVFNGAAFVEEALQSVLAQPGWDVEVVAVDDGSTDGSHALLQSIAKDESRLTVVALDGNTGVAHARNVGVEHAHRPLLAFIDQDDWWTEDHLDTCMSGLAADRSLGFVLGHQEFSRPDGDLPAWVRQRWLDGPQPGHVFGTMLAWRATWTNVGPLDESLRFGVDDVEWFARARDRGVRHRMLPEVVLVRRLHTRNASSATRGSNAELLEVMRMSLRRRDERKGGGAHA